MDESFLHDPLFAGFAFSACAHSTARRLPPLGSSAFLDLPPLPACDKHGETRNIANHLCPSCSLIISNACRLAVPARVHSGAVPLHRQERQGNSATPPSHSDVSLSSNQMVSFSRHSADNKYRHRGGGTSN